MEWLCLHRQSDTWEPGHYTGFCSELMTQMTLTHWHLPGNALMSMTACCPVWLLMITSMPNKDTPSASRKDLDSSLMTSSLGGWDTPSKFSLCDNREIATMRNWDTCTTGSCDISGSDVMDLQSSGQRTTLVWKRCGCWRKWLSCLNTEKQHTCKATSPCMLFIFCTRWQQSSRLSNLDATNPS